MGRESNGRVTNAVLSEQLKQVIYNQELMQKTIDTHHALLQAHIKDDQLYQAGMTLTLLGDPNDVKKEGIIHRLGNLEKANAKRNKHLWFIYTTIAAVILSKLPDWLKIGSITIGNAVPK